MHFLYLNYDRHFLFLYTPYSTDPYEWRIVYNLSQSWVNDSEGDVVTRKDESGDGEQSKSVHGQ